MPLPGDRECGPSRRRGQRSPPPLRIIADGEPRRLVIAGAEPCTTPARRLPSVCQNYQVGRRALVGGRVGDDRPQVQHKHPGGLRFRSVAGASAAVLTTRPHLIRYDPSHPRQRRPGDQRAVVPPWGPGCVPALIPLDQPGATADLIAHRRRRWSRATALRRRCRIRRRSGASWPDPGRVRHHDHVVLGTANTAPLCRWRRPA